MILRSSSLDRPVMTSASTPRALKISRAAGDSLSAMRTRGDMGESLFEIGGECVLRGSLRSHPRMRSTGKSDLALEAWPRPASDEDHCGVHSGPHSEAPR